MTFCEAFTDLVLVYWFARLLLAILAHPEAKGRPGRAARRASRALR